MHATRAATFVLIGHVQATPRATGTTGPAARGRGELLVETVEADVRNALPRAIPDELAFVTQTTLSVDDTAGDRRRACKARFPDDRRPAQGRHLLCHHQPAGGREGRRAERADALLVVGAPNSLQFAGASSR